MGQPTTRSFCTIFYNHAIRNPDFVEPLIEKVKAETFEGNFIERFEKKHRPITDSERALLKSSDFQEQATLNTRVENFSRQSEMVLNRLSSMTVALATPSRECKQFIVGSQPVVRFENYPRQELGKLGVEQWTSLTPKLAVGFVRCEGTPILSLTDNQVRQFNFSIAKSSSAIASKSPKLLSSLANAVWPKN